jgi:adenylate kinase family enzyme
MRRTKVIAVGVNSYANLVPLSCCGNDAKAFVEAFSERVGGADSTLLVSEDSSPRALLPTKSNIDLVLQELSSARLGADDLAVFFFAGHGYMLEKDDFLAAQDSNYTQKDTGIRCDVVLSALKQSGAGTSILFLDACRIAMDRAMSLFGERTADYARRQGTIVFFSCSSGEVSRELPILGHGIFTYSLIHALQNNATTPIELERYIMGLVSEICSSHELVPQHPYAAVFPTYNGLLNIIDGRYKEIAGPKRKNMILIAGPSNAGKTTVGVKLASILKYTHVEMSSFAWQAFTKAKYQGTIQTFMETVVWASRPMDCIAEDLLNASITLDNVVVCGPRRLEEIQRIKSSDWNVIPFFLYSSSSHRYNRFLLTMRDRYELEYKEFVKKDMKEYAWGLAQIANLPGINLLVNHGTEVDPVVTEALEVLRAADISPVI